MEEKHRELETCAVLALAAVVLLGLLHGRPREALYLAAGFLAAGLFVKPAARAIHIFWLRLAGALASVNGRLLLALVYLLVLTPLALIRRAFRKNTLQLTPPEHTMLVKREHAFGPEDLAHPY